YESMEEFMEWNDLETEEEYYEYIAAEVEWWKQEQEEAARWEQWRDEYLAANPGYVQSVLDITPAIWQEWEYESQEDFMMWYDLATQEEYTDWLVEWYLSDLYYEELYRQEMLSQRVEMGGPAEGIGVMWNGDYVKFPDAQPEITNDRTMIPVRAFMELTGAEVGFESADKRVILSLTDGREMSFVVGQCTVIVKENGEEYTVEMDVAPYIKPEESRTYVPVRFFSEAIGLDVTWDNWYRTAVIADRTKIVEEIDDSFDVLNKLMNSELVDMDKSYEVVSEMKGSVGLIDSLNGNQNAEFSGKFTGVSHGMSADLTGSIDLSEIIELLKAAEDPEDLDEETLKVLDALAKIEMEMILNGETGNFYMSSDLLDFAYGEYTSSWRPGAWLMMDLGDLISFDMTDYTIGSLLYDSCCSGGDIYGLSVLDSSVEMVKGLAGDDCFVKKADGWELIYDKDDFGALYESLIGGNTNDLKEAEFKLFIGEKGTYSASMVLSLDQGDVLPPFRFAMDMGANAMDSYANMTLHVKNEFEAELKMTESYTVTDEMPRFEPSPKHVVISEEELWLYDFAVETLYDAVRMLTA
ncbi:MAG: copper amine oxidase N-terminal domain-containing protein, partial [Eubacteriales bacterium]|nr:copper amine oxidase N-terminal domain-containing protein [Eubacteriales bacterium]